MIKSVLSKYIFIALWLITFQVLVVARAEADATWIRTFGDTGSDIAYSLVQNADGSYVMAGMTWSLTGSNRWDAWVVKMDTNGQILWQKSYGTAGDEHFKDIKKTADGGYIATGVYGTTDLWVVKLDADGAVQWQKSYGDTDIDKGESIQQTADGGYIVAGALITPYDINAYTSYVNIWLLKLDSAGNIEWQKGYYGGGYISPFGEYRVLQVKDGGYLVSGGESSSVLLKVDANGAVQWQRQYPVILGMQQTTDGGYIVAGGNALWTAKLDNAGNPEWERYYSGLKATSIQQTPDNGYIVSAVTGVSRGGMAYAMALKLDATGSMQWQKQFAGASAKVGLSISLVQTLDNGYALAGFTNSFGAGNYDAWVLKLDADGNSSHCLSGLTVTDLQTIAQDVNTGVSVAVDVRTPALSPRTTTVVPADTTASASSGGSCGISIFGITSAAGPNGSIISSGTASVNYGDSRTFTITPDAGYHVGEVLVDGVAIGTATSYTFSNVTASHTISATFAVNTYAVTPAAGQNGGIAPATMQLVNYNETTAFTVTPDTGYHIASVTGCNGTLNDSTYTTGPVADDCAVSATFAINTYALTLTKAGAGSGTVTSSPAGIDCGSSCAETYVHGTVVTLTAAPAADSIFAGWSGGECSGTGTCITTMDAAKDVTATLNIEDTPPVITASVTPSSSANGWNSADVTVTFTCSDAESGIAFCPAPVQVTTDGAGQAISGVAVDNAGNTASASLSLNIDKTAPAVTISASTSKHRSSHHDKDSKKDHDAVDVLVSGAATDSGSGISSVVITVTDEQGAFVMTVPGFGSTIKLETGKDREDRHDDHGEHHDKDGGYYTITAVALDKAGNQSTATTTVSISHDSRDSHDSHDSRDER